MTYFKTDSVIKEATFKDINDPEWQGREVKIVTFDDETPASVKLFIQDNIEWGVWIPDQELYNDCSSYNLRGDIIEHRDGTVSVHMGKTL